MSAERKLSYLYAIVGLVSILAASFLIALIVVLVDQNGHVRPPAPPPPTPSPHAPANYCYTYGCKKAAQNLRFSINTQADPCQDFYEYACGLWSHLNPIEEGTGRRTSFTVLVDQNSADLKQFLSELSNERTSNRSIRLLKQVYDACMNEDAIENVGSKPMLDLVEQAFNNTFQLKVFNEDEDSQSDNAVPLEYLVAKLWIKYGISTIVSPYVTADERNATTNILVLDQASLTLGSKSEDYYLKNDTFYQTIRSAYAETVKKVLRALYGSEQSGNSISDERDKAAKGILDFEISLASINKPAEKRRDPTKMYNKMTIEQLQETGSKFNWTNFLKLFKPVEHVNVAEPEYFQKLNSLLDETPNATVYTYLRWRLILNRLPFLARRYSDLYYELAKKLRDQDREKERSKFCVEYVTGEPDDGREFLGFATGKVFVDKKNFNSDSKVNVEKMVTELKNAFMLLLNQSTWMDETTKEKAKEKINQMISSIGYPDELHDLDAIYKPLLDQDEGYNDTEIKENDSFFEMNTKLLTWLHQRQNNQIGEPFDRHSFGGSPVIVNAWYAPSKNSIVFPAGILQPPFYDRSSPAAVNFGSIGSVIGHEITHGFDDQGAEYDSIGNLNKWWTNSSKEKFDERVKCFVDQYSRFCYPELGEGVCVKGESTKGENIADNGGIKQSFAAYKAFTAGKPQEVLPTLEQFTMDQIFFLSFANFWCGNFRNKYLQNMIDTNEHAPGRNRVIGTLQNFDEFAKAFNCPVGSVMNPEKKCAVCVTIRTFERATFSLAFKTNKVLLMYA
uniref:Peptidase M13 C-terminal domain-containing protein n=1 Tax=Trichuris muris TaxID=70415 RepID=A0A5S6QJ07_TRIMR